MSPVGDSASNGVIERGIQSVQGQIRTIKNALEARWNLRIKDEHPVLTWLVEQSSVILNKCGKKRDGRTPHERLKGKTATIITI